MSGPLPTLRLVRHLARTGGTLLSKCLGCQDGTMLLSETHPQALDRWTNLLGQAEQWHGLTTAREAQTWVGKKLPYAGVVALLNARAEAKGQRLVLREWTHLDFAGVPFVTPGMTPAATQAVENNFTLRVVDTVRHPLDHWLSIQQIEPMRGLTLAAHLASCAAFARETERLRELEHHAIVTYEAFCDHPNDVLQRMSSVLGVPFDQAWQGRWADFAFITGDIASSRGNQSDAISPLTPREVSPALLEACLANADYRQACASWGYNPER